MRVLVLPCSRLALALFVCACGTSNAPATDVPSPPDATSAVPPGGPDGSSPAPGADAGIVQGVDARAPDATSPPAPGPEGGAASGACGYADAGTPLHVAANLDLCMPPVACTSETCPPSLGDCVNDHCVFKAGYKGVATLAEAWVTYYCDLSTAGCHGVTQIEFPEVTAQKIATATGQPLCDQTDGGAGECVGISAAPPMIVGNSQLAVDSATGKPVKDWGLGLTEASGLCYELTGPSGTALVALTDRCGGYCTCSGSAPQECGPCVNAPDMQPDCPCVGSAPPPYASCCGASCGGTVNPQCDWCASNNHPHFDLDTGTFNHLCGALAIQGSCKLTGVRFVHCLDATGWPPP